VVELTFTNINKNELSLVKTIKSFPVKELDYKNIDRIDDIYLRFND